MSYNEVVLHIKLCTGEELIKQIFSIDNTVIVEEIFSFIIRNLNFKGDVTKLVCYSAKFKKYYDINQSFEKHSTVDELIIGEKSVVANHLNTHNSTVPRPDWQPQQRQSKIINFSQVIPINSVSESVMTDQQMQQVKNSQLQLQLAAYIGAKNSQYQLPEIKNNEELIILPSRTPDATPQPLTATPDEIKSDEQVMRGRQFCKHHSIEKLQFICMLNHACPRRLLCVKCLYETHNGININEMLPIDVFQEQIDLRDQLSQEQQINHKELKYKTKLLNSQLQENLEKYCSAVYQSQQFIQKINLQISKLQSQSIYESTNEELWSMIQILHEKDLEIDGIINAINLQTLSQNISRFEQLVAVFLEQLAKLQLVIISSNQCHMNQEQKTMFYNQLDLKSVPKTNDAYAKYLINYEKDKKIMINIKVITDQQQDYSQIVQVSESLKLCQLFDQIQQNFQYNKVKDDWSYFSTKQQVVFTNYELSLSQLSIASGDMIVINTLPRNINIQFEIIDLQKKVININERFKLTDTFNFLSETVLNRLKFDWQNYIVFQQKTKNRFIIFRVTLFQRRQFRERIDQTLWNQKQQYCLRKDHLILKSSLYINKQ